MADRSQNDTGRDPGASPAHGQPAAESQRLTQLLEPAVAAAGLFLEDVDVTLAGARRTVHVIVDLPEDQSGGVGLDLISTVSRSISDALDADPADDGAPYSLEVSSPGVSRPLTEPRHWRRNVSRMIRVRTTDGRDITGRLLAVQENGVQLRPELPARKGVKPKQGEPIRLAFASIRKAGVEIEFVHAEDGNTESEHLSAAEEA